MDEIPNPVGSPEHLASMSPIELKEYMEQDAQYRAEYEEWLADTTNREPF